MNVRTNILGETLDGPFGKALEREILPAWLPQRRWFRSKARPLARDGVTLEARVPLGEWPHAPLFTVVRVTFTDGRVQRYALPLVLLSREDAAGFPEGAILGPVPGENAENVLCDACWHDGFRETWMELLAGKRACELPDGTLRGHPLASARTAGWVEGPSRVLGGEQSNTAFVSGDTFVKLYRRLEEGVHPEPEMLRFLREHTDYRGVPGFLSRVEWQHGGHGTYTAALAQELVAGEDAWTHTLGVLRPLASGSGTPAVDGREVTDLGMLLGRRVGALHAALGSRPDFPAFAREPLTDADLEAVRTSTRALLDEALRALEAASAARTLPPAAAAPAALVQASRDKLGEILSRAGNGSGARGGGYKIRTHGDLHLGQILVSGDDARILDFEGEPGRPLAAARVKQSPLRDAAGMIRSFHYAAHVAAREAPATNPHVSARETGAPGHAAALADGLGAAFLAGYFEALEPAGLLPEGVGARRALLDLFVLEKAVYELHYELNNRPHWAGIPLQGLAALLSAYDDSDSGAASHGL